MRRRRRMRRVMERQAVHRLVPYSVEVRRSPGHHRVLSQQLPRALPHQQPGIGPVANKVLVVQLLGQHHVEEAQGQQPVGSWPDLEPEVGFSGQRDVPGIDDDEPRAPFAGGEDPDGLGGPGGVGVVSPQQDAGGALEVRVRNSGSIRVAGAVVLVPTADVPGGNRIGTAEQAGEADQPRLVLRRRAAPGRPAVEENRLRAVAVAETSQPLDDLVHGLVPTHPGPARVGIALGSRAPQRIAQPLRVVHQLGRRLPLDADAPVGMVRVGLQPNEAPVLDGRHDAAAGLAHGAIGADFLFHVAMLSDCESGFDTSMTQTEILRRSSGERLAEARSWSRRASGVSGAGPVGGRLHRSGPNQKTR